MNNASMVADIMVHVPNVRADFARATLNKLANANLQKLHADVQQLAKKGDLVAREASIVQLIEKTAGLMPA